MTTGGDVQALVEMTDTVGLPYTTGLQRVARELVARLPAEGPVAYRPVVWSPVCDGFRSLTGDESHALTHPRQQLPASTALARRLPRPVAAGVRQVLATGAGRRARSTLQDAAHRRAERPHVGLCLGSPGPSTVLLDLEAAWNDPVPRTELLDQFRRAGARSAAMIADVLPVLHPEWFDSQLLVDFDEFLNGHLAHSDLFLCISERTRKDLLLVAEQRGVKRELRTRVIPLGSDLGPTAPSGDATSDPTSSAVGEDTPATRGRYLLTVGTIEPRKNQGLALDAFDALAGRYPDLGLVLVGKRGWKVDELIRRIETDRYYGDRLLWLEEVDDDRLAHLYRGATLALAPARYEGLGMTVMESLRLGTPVIASSGGALPEAGGDAAEYAHPDDTAAWISLVERHLDDPAHHEAAIRRVAAHELPTWDGAAAAVTAAMVEVFGPGGPRP